MFDQKRPWKFIPLLLTPSLLFLLFGNIRWAILSLGLVPGSFLLWKMYQDVFSDEANKFREIKSHLSESERRELSRLSSDYGTKLGIISVLWIAPIAVYFSFYNMDIPFFIWTILLSESVDRLLFSKRLRKPLVDFAFSTEYAKKMGWERG